MSRKDIIRWVIECAMRHDDSITQELALVIERECRAEWGGQRIEYVPRHVNSTSRGGRPPTDAEVAQRAVNAVVRGGRSPAEAASDAGVSRRTIYNLLKSRGGG